MARFYHRLSVFKENHVKTFDLTGFAKSALLVMLASIVALHVAPATAQDGGWTHWGADAASTRYAPFDQIDASNFGDLEVAWGLAWRQLWAESLQHPALHADLCRRQAVLGGGRAPHGSGDRADHR